MDAGGTSGTHRAFAALSVTPGRRAAPTLVGRADESRQYLRDPVAGFARSDSRGDRRIQRNSYRARDDSARQRVALSADLGPQRRATVERPARYGAAPPPTKDLLAA